MGMKPLTDRSLSELEDAKKHIEELEAFAAREVTSSPGPGWQPVREMLARDLAEVETEIGSRDS